VALADRTVNIQTWDIQRRVRTRLAEPASRISGNGTANSHSNSVADTAETAATKDECVHFGQRPSRSIKYLTPAEIADRTFRIYKPLSESKDGQAPKRYIVQARMTTKHFSGGF